MKKHILIAGSILVGVGIMNVIPVKNNEGEILKDDVIVSDVIENKKETEAVFSFILIKFLVERGSFE